MPVQPVISLEQIVIIVAFLMMLFGLMWFLRRHRGGITSRLNADRRMKHIEELSVAPQQRLHLIEVDGRLFLVHAGKGHAASFIAVGGEAAPSLNTPSPTPVISDRRKEASSKKAATDPVASKLKNAFGTAIAQARSNNPSLEFGK